MTNYQLMSDSQIVAFNPILQAHSKVKNAYCRALADFVDKIEYADDTWSDATKNFYGEYSTINNDSNNLILYVLNGTQLSTNDDVALWDYVAES